MESIESQLRKLAKTDRWQALFGYVKESNPLVLFQNHDLTYLQLYFLNQLSFYSNLYFDIAMKEVSELVLDNEIYEDAYWHYKCEKRKQSPKQGVSLQPNQSNQETVKHTEIIYTKAHK